MAGSGLLTLPILASAIPGVLPGPGPTSDLRSEFVSGYVTDFVPGFVSELVSGFASELASMEARAQVPWESPRMLPPDGPAGLGFYFVRFESLPGADYGGAFTWHPPGFPDGLSLRAGAANGTRDRTAGFGGIDFSAPLVEHSGEMPLDLEWSTGLGVAIGDYVLASLPVGVTAGRAWSSGQVRIGPYVGVHAVMDYRAGGTAPEEEFEVEPSAEVGLDVSFDERRRVVLRAAAALGDRSTLILGFVLGGGE